MLPLTCKFTLKLSATRSLCRWRLVQRLLISSGLILWQNKLLIYSGSIYFIRKNWPVTETALFDNIRVLKFGTRPLLLFFCQIHQDLNPLFNPFGQWHHIMFYDDNSKLFVSANNWSKLIIFLVSFGAIHGRFIKNIKCFRVEIVFAIALIFVLRHRREYLKTAPLWYIVPNRLSWHFLVDFHYIKFQQKIQVSHDCHIRTSAIFFPLYW